MTEWKWILYLFVKVADNTAENRTAFAHTFVDNSSGESLADERKLFDSAVRLSTTGNEPAQVIGLGTSVKAVMRTDIQAILDGLDQSRYFGVAAIQLPSFFEDELLSCNKAGLVGVPPWDTTPFTWQDALNDLFVERGLQVIVEEI